MPASAAPVELFVALEDSGPDASRLAFALVSVICGMTPFLVAPALRQ